MRWATLSWTSRAVPVFFRRAEHSQYRRCRSHTTVAQALHVGPRSRSSTIDPRPAVPMPVRPVEPRQPDSDTRHMRHPAGRRASSSDSISDRQQRRPSGRDRNFARHTGPPEDLVLRTHIRKTRGRGASVRQRAEAPVYCSPQGMVAAVTRRVLFVPPRRRLLGGAPQPDGRLVQLQVRGMRRLTGACPRPTAAARCPASTMWSIRLATS